MTRKVILNKKTRQGTDSLAIATKGRMTSFFDEDKSQSITGLKPKVNVRR